MKRTLLLSFMVASALAGYACSSDSTSEPPPTNNPDGSVDTDTGTTPDKDGGGGTDATTETDGTVPTGNPIEGVGAPTVVAAFSTQYLEGPAWVGNSLYVSEITVPGNLIQFSPGAAVGDQVKLVRTAAAGSIIIGSTPDPKVANNLLSVEVIDQAAGGSIVRTPVATVPAAGTPIALTTDGGGPPAFDSPNDIVVNKDGVMYVSDPGYQNPGTVNNHIWRISATGEVFETVSSNRPNGIALSPDEKTLYVSYTDNPSRIDKFALGAAGAIGAKTKFVDISPGNNTADGLAVDTAGNVYCAVKDGVDVFKPDGTKWGHIPTVAGRAINGIAFGGADKKTLFMTANGGAQGGLLQVTVKVAGITQ
ncbi:MAG: SMP-30/gluconolactonase/LRE family protein [Deltaproteobacteria bacterium]|nr:SMP-30/gluconolactonase/LRE family protein [Deltaproteobacteria bacterium]